MDSEQLLDMLEGI